MQEIQHISDQNLLRKLSLPVNYLSAANTIHLRQFCMTKISPSTS